jgi:hypothetical protein
MHDHRWDSGRRRTRPESRKCAADALITGMTRGYRLPMHSLEQLTADRRTSLSSGYRRYMHSREGHRAARGGPRPGLCRIGDVCNTGLAPGACPDQHLSVTYALPVPAAYGWPRRPRLGRYRPRMHHRRRLPAPTR